MQWSQPVITLSFSCACVFVCVWVHQDGERLTEPGWVSVSRVTSCFPLCSLAHHGVVLARVWLQEYFAFFLVVSIVIGVLLVLAAGASLYIVTYTIFMATVFTIGSYVMIFVGASELFILQCVGAGAWLHAS